MIFTMGYPHGLETSKPSKKLMQKSGEFQGDFFNGLAWIGLQ
jgi:thiol:disulfide interchange protein